ncbi:hypothetical protein QVD17_28090 [Tagetes erecta]|uniref:Uncharacterized protein n=1 Tax=Tagetes erecta TaxID=13708 RepID=A0AAD8NRX7_TARER|nr:hypothetical protein QVD17_28090 [Tagetes erecta]
MWCFIGNPLQTSYKSSKLPGCVMKPVYMTMLYRLIVQTNNIVSYLFVYIGGFPLCSNVLRGYSNPFYTQEFRFVPLAFEN